MLIQGGWVIQPRGVEALDFRIEGGCIVDMGQLTPYAGEDVYDATGRHILPGGIDAHTHFDMPAGAYHTYDDFFTGTQAAIAGGTTTIIDFAECDDDAPLQTGLDTWHDKARGKSLCDYTFHMTISHVDVTTPAQMADMVAQGITSFKVYTAYEDSIGLCDRDLFTVFETAAQLGATVCVHCENGQIIEHLQSKLDPALPINHAKSRPNLTEAQAVAKVASMAQMTGCQVYIVHLSTKEGLEEVVRFQEKGVSLWAETCPHYLLLNQSYLEGGTAPLYICSPPLRSEADQVALWQGLRSGAIATLSTDHCAFSQEDKYCHPQDYRKIPNGLPSVGLRMALAYHHGYNHGLTLSKIAEITATNPAKAFGLFPQKGVLAVGSDADFVVANFTQSVPLDTTGHPYDLYPGQAVNMTIEQVYLRGQLLSSRDDTKPSSGQFLPAKVSQKEI